MPHLYHKSEIRLFIKSGPPWTVISVYTKEKVPTSILIHSSVENLETSQSECKSVNFNATVTGTFFCMLKTLNPDQTQQNVWPVMEPKCLTFWWYLWKSFFCGKSIFKNPPPPPKKKKKKKKKNSAEDKSKRTKQEVLHCSPDFFLLVS